VKRQVGPTPHPTSQSRHKSFYRSCSSLGWTRGTLGDVLSLSAACNPPQHSGTEPGRAWRAIWGHRHQSAMQERDCGLKPTGFRGMSEKMSRSRLLVVAFVLCLAVSGIPALAAEHTFDGDYSGKRVLTKGSVGPDCPAEDDVSVNIHGIAMTFTNSALKKFAIGFFVRKDGSFDQIHTDVDGTTVHVVGRITGDIIEADVDNPPCVHHWHLKKE
jgi:hypothetical protein